MTQVSVVVDPTNDVAVVAASSSGSVVAGPSSVVAHTHPATDINDSTVAGRALLTAANAAAQRTVIGLETTINQTVTANGTGAVARSVDLKLKDVVSVKDFGAVGDGVTDDTDAIQAAINAPSKSIFFPAGTYRTTAALSATAKRFYGETQIHSILLLDHSGTGLEFINTDTYGMSIEKLCIQGNGSSVAITIQSSTEVTSHCHFEDVRIYNHSAGITGAGTFTLFDAYLEKVDFLACSAYGFKLSGSQNTLVGCTFRLCGYGILVEDMPLGFSVGGASITSGVFVGNSYDVVINTTVVRPLSFNGVWFEQTANLTVGKLTGGSEVFFTTLNFDKCLFQPASTAIGDGVIDGFNYKGIASFRNCIVFADLYSAATLPSQTIGLGDSNCVVDRQSCAVVNAGGTVTPLRDYTTNSLINLINIYNNRLYASDAAAGTAGLVTGDLYYNTTSGSLTLKN